VTTPTPGSPSYPPLQLRAFTDGGHLPCRGLGGQAGERLHVGDLGDRDVGHAVHHHRDGDRQGDELEDHFGFRDPGLDGDSP
jgi:hypothetical protein